MIPSLSWQYLNVRPGSLCRSLIQSVNNQTTKVCLESTSSFFDMPEWESVFVKLCSLSLSVSGKIQVLTPPPIDG